MTTREEELPGSAGKSLGVLNAPPRALCSSEDSQAIPATESFDLGAYVAIARPDHWPKNIFMVLGVMLAYFYYPKSLSARDVWVFLWSLAATCLVVSSNYVLNEILDARTDRSHPTKCTRPIPSGRVDLRLAYLEWMLLALVGSIMAYALNFAFFVAAILLLIMGVIYNVPPIRSKQHAYVDVLSEAINNPVRLLLGWFVVSPTKVPPVSLLLCYWMGGAFLMASKRFAEYRSIGDPKRAARYRSSFGYYDEGKLVLSMFFYSTAAALFLGIFIVRYRLELILAVPLIAGFFTYYVRISLKDGSAAQAPERLYRERGLMVYLTVTVIVFFALMLIDFPGLYELLNVEHSLPSVWEIR